MHWNSRRFAEKLIVRGLVGVLKSSPAADIVDKDCAIGWGSNYISQKLLKTRSTAKNKAALRSVGICADDLETSDLRILLDRGELVLKRILLVFG
jgi:hypothetical protein